jgi:glycosyltransferase involved in cell wall biosynthesis/peptidoglycan/xylan/chitin deacetylase (PgdA/CDA1 family)
VTALRDIRARLTAFLGKFAPIRSAADWVLDSGAAIFAFHRVLPRGADCYEPEMCISQDAFAEFLDWLAERYRVLPLDEITCGSPKTSGKRPSCAITFDDGWYDNFVFAFPELKRRGLPATIFLPTRFIGTHRRFWQEELWLCLRCLKGEQSRSTIIENVARGFPWFPPPSGDLNSYGGLKRLLLSRPSSEAEEFTRRIAEYANLTGAFPDRSFVNWEEVREMETGKIRFGSHTLNHVLLTNAPPGVAGKEIRDSREELQSRVAEEVAAFAYPWGAFGRSSADQVRGAGYKFGVTTRSGLVDSVSNPFLLPRIAVSNTVLANGEDHFDPNKTKVYFAKSVVTDAARNSVTKNHRNGKERIKIFFVLDLITEWEGGTERQVQLLIRSLDPKYFEPKLCFLFAAPELPKESLPCPLHVVGPSSGGLPSLPVRLYRLIRLLREERPDIVQAFFVEGLIAGILAGRLAGVPRVVGSVRNNGYWRTLGYRLAMKAITPLAHRWQTNSRALWQYQNKNESVSAAKIEILPNGTDISRLSPATPQHRDEARRALGLPENVPIFVSVANLAKVKDFPTLINGAALLRQQLPDLIVLIVGDGEERRDLEKLAARVNMSDNIRFVGRQPDVRPYLAAADIGVLTSISEGSSNSVLEYMAMGLPSVVSDIAPNRELLGGLFFPPGDALALSRQIMALWSNPRLRAQLSQEYVNAAQEFSIQKFAYRAEGFYNRLAAEIGPN